MASNASNTIFNFIDGYNLDKNELKSRLIKMGLDKYLKGSTDHAKIYNDILNSGDKFLISKIKRILDTDRHRANYSQLLHKKRNRDAIDNNQECDIEVINPENSKNFDSLNR